MKLTFLCSNKQVVLQELLEDLTHMLRRVSGKDQDTYSRSNMSRRTTFTRFWKMVGVLIEPNIEYPKWPRGSVEGRLPFISFTDLDQVVSIAEVKPGEHERYLERIKSEVHERQRIFVLYCYVIESSQIDARAKDRL